MIIHYRINLYDGTGPTPVEVLDSDFASIVRIRDLATNDIHRARRADQVFPTFNEAKLALINYNLLNIEFAEQKLATARKRLHALITMPEPEHE